MKRRSVIVGGLALAASPMAAAASVLVHDAPRRMLSPPFFDGGGRDLTLESFRGRVILLNLWATWCPPCRQEMPALDRLQAHLGSDDFHVLALSIDDTLEHVRRFYADVGVRWLEPYLAEELRVMLAFAVVGFPTTILVDRAGRERGRRVGPARWDGRTAVRQIRTLIAERTTDQ